MPDWGMHAPRLPQPATTLSSQTAAWPEPRWDGEALAVAMRLHGGVVLRQAIAPERCRALKRRATELMAAHAPAATVLLGLSSLEPAFHELHADPQLLSALAEIMPDGVAFLSDKAVFKSHRHGFATPLHVDAAYWRGTRAKISLWIALEDARIGNGCLSVVPGSHLRDWSHQAGQVDMTNGEFAAVLAEPPSGLQVQPVELATGDVLVFTDTLVHGSYENRSGEDRWCAILTYHAPQEDEPFDLGFPARRVLMPGPGARFRDQAHSGEQPGQAEQAGRALGGRLRMVPPAARPDSQA